MYPKTLVAILFGLCLTIWESNASPTKTNIINALKRRDSQSFKIMEVSKDLKPAIVGGKNVTDGEIPYQVALLLDNGSVEKLCGGSILNPNWILTAAHCVYDMTNILILAGTANIKKNGVKRSVIKRIIYPTFMEMPANDIALLKLNESLPIGENIKAVKLPEKGTNVEGIKALASGWGVNEERRPQTQLKSLVTETISAKECFFFTSFFGATKSTNICTINKINKGVCSGDSGGPLVDYESYKQRKPIQIGISAAVLGGCGRGYPDIFVQVSNYLDFINKHINN